jgi:nucleoside diphosphate kinase
MDFITSDVVVGMELVSENAVMKWRSCLGPTNTLVNLYSKPLDSKRRSS